MIGPKKPSDPIALSALHQRTIAVQLTVQGSERLMIGRGVYGPDPALGAALRILFPSDTDCEILLIESEWQGEVRAGDPAVSDFLIRLG